MKPDEWCVGQNIKQNNMQTVSTFIACIHSMNKMRVTFYSKEDRGVITRTCAPMDFAPSARSKDKSNRFHFWDYDSDQGSHTLSLRPDQIVSMQFLQEKFVPTFVSWRPNWVVSRTW